MQNIQLETIQTETLESVTGGSWLEMLSGGKFNIATLLGGANKNGGIFGVNKEGKGKGLAEGISGLFRFGDEPFKTVEGRDR